MFNSFSGLVLSNRSYRRFDSSKEISSDTLLDLINLARNTPSAANKQLIRYKITNDTFLNEKVFSCLKWAGYLADWDGPVENERPTAYITLLAPKSSPNATATDEGIVCQTILLGARTLGLGGCILGNIDREHLSSYLDIPDEYCIKLVIALGAPVEHVILKDIDSTDCIKYYREDDGTHVVPKIKLEDVVL